MSMNDRDHILEMEILYGLLIEAPPPAKVRDHPMAGQYHNRNRYLMTCPDCGLEIRDVGYKSHWAKAHRQAAQLRYFKQLLNKKGLK